MYLLFEYFINKLLATNTAVIFTVNSQDHVFASKLINRIRIFFDKRFPLLFVNDAATRSAATENPKMLQW